MIVVVVVIVVICATSFFLKLAGWLAWLGLAWMGIVLCCVI